jgi:hypothetical protein
VFEERCELLLDQVHTAFSELGIAQPHGNTCF